MTVMLSSMRPEYDVCSSVKSMRMAAASHTRAMTTPRADTARTPLPVRSSPRMRICPLRTTSPGRTSAVPAFVRMLVTMPSRAATTSPAPVSDKGVPAGTPSTTRISSVIPRQPHSTHAVSG